MRLGDGGGHRRRIGTCRIDDLRGGEPVATRRLRGGSRPCASHRRERIARRGDRKRDRCHHRRRHRVDRIAPLAKRAHVRLHCQRIGVPLLPTEGERPIDHLAQSHRQVRSHARERRRREARHLDQHVGVRLRLVHALPGQHPEHRRTHREQIRPLVHLLALDLFGRHVRHRPDRYARPRLERLRRPLLHARNPEVEHLDPPVALQEQIVRLDVAMDDPVRVRSRKHVEQLVGDAQYLRRLDLLLTLDAIVEALALE